MKRNYQDTDMVLVVIVDEKDEQKVVSVGTSASLKDLQEAAGKAFNTSPSQITLLFADMTLQEGPLSAQIPSEGAIVMLRKRKFHLSDIPSNPKPEDLLQYCDEHEHLLSQITSADPELADSLKTKDVGKVRLLMMSRALKQHKSIFDREKEMKAIWDDPDNEENQKKIADMIQKEQIEQSHHMAMEENPESFASVYMLYIPLEISNVPLKAFVDSGAQMTIMSADCAERCGILRLMDTRYQGMASGVGTAKILGKIHMVQCKVGNSFFPISVTILENASMDVLFGLDTLKRYRCAIDLNKNVLRMEDGSAGPEEVAFLSEGEIPGKSKDGNTADGTGFLGGDKKESSENPPAPADVDEVKVKTLQEMGFTRKESIDALQATSGNAEEAANLLFASK